LSLGEDPKSVTNYLNVTKGEEDNSDGGDVVTPTVQIFLGKVIKDLEFIGARISAQKLFVKF